MRTSQAGPAWRLVVLLIACANTPLIAQVPPQKVRASDKEIEGWKVILVQYQPGSASEVMEAARSNGFDVKNYAAGSFLICTLAQPGDGEAMVLCRKSLASSQESLELTQTISRATNPPPSSGSSILPNLPNLANLENQPSNDPYFPKQWGLRCIRAPEAWASSPAQSSSPVVVALISTGIDYNHEDLAGCFWLNPGETGKDRLGRDKANNNVDDDGNGLIVDVHGWDFFNEDNDPSPEEEAASPVAALLFGKADSQTQAKKKRYEASGTHLCGIIGAKGNNRLGCAGIAWGARIIPLKVYGDGMGTVSSIIRAMDYALNMSSKIILIHGADLVHSFALEEAIRRASSADALVVVAAGNGGQDIDVTPEFPAAYSENNILSVMSIDPAERPSSTFTNYGRRTVDIAAPGGRNPEAFEILSTLPHNEYGYLAGSSMAAAHAAGAAALVWGHPSYRGLKAVEVQASTHAEGQA